MSYQIAMYTLNCAVDVVKNVLNLTWRKIQILNVCFIPSDQFNCTFNCILNVNVRDFSVNLNNINKIVNERTLNIKQSSADFDFMCSLAIRNNENNA